MTELSGFIEVAEELGIDRHAVRGLVKALRIKPKRIPLSPAGKGLTREDVARLRLALGLREGEKAAAR